MRLRTLNLLTVLLPTIACQSASFSGAGLDVQGYPAGVITTARADWEVSPRRTVSVHAGYNATDRQDFGEHDDETGGGPGLGVSGRHYFGEEHAGWFAGGRLDLWLLDIDWEDDSPSRAGSSDAVVLQPTVQGGYRWDFGDGDWSLDLYGAAGAEINLDTDGEDVGEGAIGLLGVALTYGF